MAGLRVMSYSQTDILRVLLFSFFAWAAVLPGFTWLGGGMINFRLHGSYLMLLFATAVLVRKILNRELPRLNFVSLFFWYVFANLVFTSVLVRLNSPEITLYLTPLFVIGTYFVGTDIRSPEFFLLCLKGIIIAGVVESLIGFLQATIAWPVFPHLTRHGEELFELDNGRNYFVYILPGIAKSSTLACGTFHHFNYLSCFTVVLLPTAYTVWQYYRTYFWFFCFCAIYLGLISTFSRGGLLGGTMGVFVIYILRTRYKYFKLYFLGVALVSLAVVVGAAVAQYAKETGNAEVRYETWKYSFNYAVQQPQNLLFGYGLNHFKAYVINDPRVVWMTQNALIMSSMHSTHVQVFLEQGIVGFFLFYLMLLLNVVQGFRMQSIWGYTLLAHHLSFYFNEFFEHATFSYVGYLFYGIIGLYQGVMMRFPDMPESAAEARERYSPPVRSINATTTTYSIAN